MGYEKIAAFGAEYAANTLGCEVMVDDSGMFIRALGGFPGPYSAYVFDTLGNERILKLMEGETDRKAVFRCVIGYCRPGEKARFSRQRLVFSTNLSHKKYLYHRTYNYLISGGYMRKIIVFT